MSTTKDFFQATQRQPVFTKLGALTLNHAVRMHDAISGIVVCCHHALANYPGSERFLKHCETLNGDLSIAKIQRVLRLWYRWTHQHRNDVPSASTVQSFLIELSSL